MWFQSARRRYVTVKSSPFFCPVVIDVSSCKKPKIAPSLCPLRAARVFCSHNITDIKFSKAKWLWKGPNMWKQNTLVHVVDKRFSGNTYLFTSTRSNGGQKHVKVSATNSLKNHGLVPKGETIDWLPISLQMSWQIWAPGWCHNKSLGTCRGGPRVETCRQASREQEAFQMAGWCHNGQILTVRWKSEPKSYTCIPAEDCNCKSLLNLKKLRRTDSCITLPHFCTSSKTTENSNGPYCTSETNDIALPRKLICLNIKWQKMWPYMKQNVTWYNISDYLILTVSCLLMFT